MDKILIEQLGRSELEDRGVFSWGVWEKGISHFDWMYNSTEVCYILEGKAEIETPTGVVNITAGDFVTFPQGLACHWNITSPIKKHYTFS